MTSVSISAPDKELSDLLDFSAVCYVTFALFLIFFVYNPSVVTSMLAEEAGIVARDKT